MIMMKGANRMALLVLLTGMAAIATIIHSNGNGKGNGNDDRPRRLTSVSDYSDPKSTTLRRTTTTTGVYANSTNIIEPYNQHNIRLTPPAFDRELFLLYYDPTEDTFQLYIDETKDKYENSEWSMIWNRLNTIVPMLAFALRNHYPSRFKGAAEQGDGASSSEFIVLVSSGDLPQLSCDCVNEDARFQHPNLCLTEYFAPILQFGSMFADRTILPTAVTMPVWHHLPCFKEWQQYGSLCKTTRTQFDVAGVLGGEKALAVAASAGDKPLDSAVSSINVWDRLIPTLIWRGSDFYFLECIHPRVRPGGWKWDVAPRLAQFGDHARGVVQSLYESWSDLTPRWKGVVLTALYQLDIIEQERLDAIPWIDVKFTLKSQAYGKTVQPNTMRYQPFQEYGIQTTGEYMSLSELSHYKYHVDFGGGGGTSWYGTIDKLAMPGVLFHHVTSTYDYFHHDLVPWKHYIPVDEGLTNLREMYEWAESNPEDAHKISEAGTQYAKSQATPGAMDATYKKYFVNSLKEVVDAYQPMKDEMLKKRMKDYLSRWTLVAKCSGLDINCEYTKSWKVE